MTATNPAASAGTARPCRISSLDPFSIEYFDDPHPTQELLREAGPLVYLDKWNVYGVARYAEVHAVLNDPATFCSSRGVGLSDFAKEKPWRPPSIILEADPPAHTRTRAVLSQVLSPTAMKQVRDRFAAAAAAKVDELLERRQFRRHRRSGGSLSAVDLSRCARAEAGRARESAALCGRRLQRVRPAEPAAPGRDRALGAASGLCRRTVPARKPRARRLRRLHPCARRCRRHHRGRGAAAGALAAVGRARHHRQRHRRRGLLPGALSRPVGAAAQRSDAGAQRVRGGRAVREPGADLLPHHDARGRDRRASRSARARRS